MLGSEALKLTCSREISRPPMGSKTSEQRQKAVKRLIKPFRFMQRSFLVGLAVKWLVTLRIVAGMDGLLSLKHGLSNLQAAWAAIFVLRNLTYSSQTRVFSRRQTVFNAMEFCKVARPKI